MATVQNQTREANRHARKDKTYAEKITTAQRTCGETYNDQARRSRGKWHQTQQSTRQTPWQWTTKGAENPCIGDAGGHAAASFDCAAASKTNARATNKQYLILTSTIAGGHTASNAPDLFRPPKLSGAGPG